MKKRKERHVLFLIFILLVMSGIILCFFMFRKKVEVIPVSEISKGNMEEEDVLTGTASDLGVQKIWPEEEKRAEKIMIKEGDSVEEGTPLLQYDVSSSELALAKSEVKIKQIRNKIEGTDHEIRRIQESEDEDKKELTMEQIKQKESYSLELKKEQQHYEQIKEELKKGTVYSTGQGIVTNVKDLPEYHKNDGPVIEITGGTGIRINIEIPEYLSEKVKTGDKLTADMPDFSASYEAEVISTDTYPSRVTENTSYYRVAALIRESGDLKEGSELQIYFQQDAEEGLWIEKAYIREENGKKFVLKENKKGKLEKTYIKTGKTGFNMTEEVLEGLKDTDYIAFPYGKGVKEGAAAQRKDRERD